VPLPPGLNPMLDPSGLVVAPVLVVVAVVAFLASGVLPVVAAVAVDVVVVEVAGEVVVPATGDE